MVMESVFSSFATGLAETAQRAFVWAMPMLALWRAFTPSLDVSNWHLWLRRVLLVGACGCLVGVIAFVLSMIDRFTSSHEYERYELLNRWTGPYAWGFWAWPLVLLMTSAILLLARRRGSWWIAWAVALPLAMPFERFVIIITSLHRDYLPSSWSLFHRSWLYLAAPIAILLSAPVMLWAQRRPMDEKGSSMK